MTAEKTLGVLERIATALENANQLNLEQVTMMKEDRVMAEEYREGSKKAVRSYHEKVMQRINQIEKVIYQ